MSEQFLDQTGTLRMGSQRILALGGLLLVVSGMIFGDIFAVFILHPNNARIGQELFGAAQAVAAMDASQVLAHFQKIGGYLENRGTKVDAHSHIANLGYLAILLALAQPYVVLSRQMKVRLAQLFLAGAVILPPSVFAIHYVGLAYSPLAAIGWASIFADLGGFLVILACCGQFLGLLNYLRRSALDPAAQVLVPTAAGARLLLVGGAVLLLLGFVFGAYYAATSFEQIAAKELQVLNDLLLAASAGSNEAIAQQMQLYGGVMAERGIKIAAHAHINELGLLLMLLAFLQPLVFLAPRWQKRWALAMLIGAVGLPFAVLMELRYGLKAGAVADLCGLLMIIAVFAMMLGIYRHTGRVDGAQS